MPEVVDIYEDSAGGLRVWPPIVFVHKAGGTIRWQNHTAHPLDLRDLPANVFVGVGNPHPIGAAVVGAPTPSVPAPAPGHPVGPAAVRGRTYKYNVTYTDPATGITIWAKGSESGVD